MHITAYCHSLARSYEANIVITRLEISQIKEH